MKNKVKSFFEKNGKKLGMGIFIVEAIKFILQNDTYYEDNLSIENILYGIKKTQ
jgi:hypothetical protein